MNMRRLSIIYSLLLVLFSTLSCEAQVFTTVTATLQDSSLQTWANATIIATLRPAPNNPGLPLNNGHTITDSPQTVVADGTGTFVLVLDDTSKITPSGATWIFNIYPNATVQNGSSIVLPVTGVSVNYSGVLSSILIPPTVFAAPSINRAYNDTQVNGGTGGIYWNTTTNVIRGCVLSAGICNWLNIGSIGVPGNHFYIPYNNGGGSFTASANLQFNDVTNTFTSVNESLTGNFSAQTLLGSFAGTPIYTGLNTFNAGIATTQVASNHYQGNPLSAPTCTFDTGGGTGPSCSLISGSGDSTGQILLGTGTSASATGTFTLTYNVTFSGTFQTDCVVMAAEGTGLHDRSWDPQVSFVQTSGVITNSKFRFNNAGNNLVDSSTYRLNYFCFGT